MGAPPAHAAAAHGNCPDELSVGQAQQEVFAEVLPEEEGALLGA